MTDSESKVKLFPVHNWLSISYSACNLHNRYQEELLNLKHDIKVVIFTVLVQRHKSA